MKKQISNRQRRARKTRHRLRILDVPRLSVHLSSQHIYAQVLSPDGSKVLAVASTLDKEVRAALDKSVANVKSAGEVGKFVAKRAIAAGVTKVGFDRSGFKYHGRVKALADAARENGLIF